MNAKLLIEYRLFISIKSFNIRFMIKSQEWKLIHTGKILFLFFLLCFWYWFLLNNLTKDFILKKNSDNNPAFLYFSTIQIISDFVILFWFRKPKRTRGVTSRPNDPRINLYLSTSIIILVIKRYETRFELFQPSNQSSSIVLRSRSSKWNLPTGS